MVAASTESNSLMTVGLIVAQSTSLTVPVSLSGWSSGGLEQADEAEVAFA